jgi:hypothetical protein
VVVKVDSKIEPSYDDMAIKLRRVIVAAGFRSETRGSLARHCNDLGSFSDT